MASDRFMAIGTSITVGGTMRFDSETTEAERFGFEAVDQSVELMFYVPRSRTSIDLQIDVISPFELLDSQADGGVSVFIHPRVKGVGITEFSVGTGISSRIHVPTRTGGQITGSVGVPFRIGMDWTRPIFGGLAETGVYLRADANMMFTEDSDFLYGYVGIEVATAWHVGRR